LNKSEIKSAISIEFALSIEEASNIVDGIFKVMRNYLIKNRKIELRKFGKIIMTGGKNPAGNDITSLCFIPSRKLAKRVNYNFGNLEKVKMEFKKIKADDADRVDFEIPDELANQFKETNEEVLDIILEEIIKQPEGKRILIPDNLIKLHREITEAKEDGKNNLWG
jgi:nucleoid DNA-binding protein